MKIDLKFSVLIPYYNRPHIIKSVIKALLSQPSFIHEIIIGCDGCKEPAISNPLIKFLKTPENCGLTVMRNRLLAEAESDYVLFLDSDAVIYRDFFTNLIHNYNPEYIFAGREYKSPKKGLANLYRNRFWVQTLGEKALCPAPFLMGICFGGNRKLFADAFGFNTGFKNYGEDLDFSFRAERKGIQIQYIPKLRIFHYRNDSLKSMFKMVTNHSLHQIRAYGYNRKPVLPVLYQSLLWIPVSCGSALKRFKNPLLSLLCFCFGITAFILKMTAVAIYRKKYDS